MNKYKIIIYWSEEDKVFIAEVPELPGCMTHGSTQATALANANKAVKGWIDTANMFGDPIPKPKQLRKANRSVSKKGHKAKAQSASKKEMRAK